MTIQKKDLFHGAALTQIVEHERFKALNKADDRRYGHYLMNHNVVLSVKYATTARQSNYSFTFSPKDIDSIKRDALSGKEAFVVLVCGEVVIACLTFDDIQDKFEFDVDAVQSLRVRVDPGKRLRVTGGKGISELLIPRNRFPDCLFEVAH